MMGLLTLHLFTTSFQDPKPEIGKLWKCVLEALLQTPKRSYVHWGTGIEDPQMALIV